MSTIAMVGEANGVSLTKPVNQLGIYLNRQQEEVLLHFGSHLRNLCFQSPKGQDRLYANKKGRTVLEQLLPG